MAKESNLLAENRTRLTSLHSNILKERFNPKADIFSNIGGIILNEYKFKMLPSSTGPHPAEVLEILHGPTTVGPGKTKTVRFSEEEKLQELLLMGRKEFEEKKRSSAPNPIRVLAKVYDTDLDLDFVLPPPYDKLLNSLHGEFWGVGDSAQLKSIQVGQVILVTMPNKESRSSPFNGQPAGSIIGIANESVISRMVQAMDLAGNAMEKDCPPPKYKDAGRKKLVVDTFSNFPIKAPTFKHIKSRNKTGIYGDGTAQTKAHFALALKNAPPSAKYKIGGPAPGPDNAFIWVGHLKNNGYMDLLDRPLGPGRETIIYCSKMLDYTQPIEIKYYLHDIGGFGNAFIRGPKTEVGIQLQSNNDFFKKIAPAIKDLVKDGRNTVLVIPEMLYSRGFGTANNDHARLGDISKGDMAPDTRGIDSTTEKPSMRTKVALNKSLTRSMVEAYLSGLPVKTNENLFQVTRLENREFNTFDGSFAGGNFYGMHQEVLDVIQNYLGIPYDAVNYVSVVADGLGAVTMAALANNVAFSAEHVKAEQDFRMMKIDRFDFIDRGKDKSRYFHFKHLPPIVFFQKYLELKTESIAADTIEFNYYTEFPKVQTSAVAELFTHTPSMSPDFANFNMANSGFDASLNSYGAPKDNAGEKKFTFNPGTPKRNNLIMQLHTVNPNKAGQGDMAVGHAFAYVNKSGLAKEVPMRKRSSFSQVTSSPMPNHGGAVSSKTEAASIVALQKERDELIEKINYFTAGLSSMAASGDTSSVCKDDKYKVYCKNGLLYFGPEGQFFKDYVAWWNNLKRTKVINNVIAYELLLKGVRDQKTAHDHYYARETEYKESKEAIEQTHPNSAVIAYGVENLSTKGIWEKYMLGHFDINLVSSQAIFSQKIGSVTSPPGLGSSQSLLGDIVIAMAEVDSKRIMMEKAKQRWEHLKKSDAPSKPPDCEETPRPMAESPYQAPGVDMIGTAPTTLCNGKRFKRAFMTAGDLLSHIPYVPTKEDFSYEAGSFTDADGNTASTVISYGGPDKKTKLEEVPVFQKSKFSHETRSRNGSVKKVKKKGPSVWACLAPRLEVAWQRASVSSNYYPFVVSSGLIGAYTDEKGGGKEGVVAYENGVSPSAYGLTINIDPFLCGSPNIIGSPAASVWTGAWTPGIGGNPAIAKELFDMGVFDDRYKEFVENCWEDFGDRKPLLIDTIGEDEAAMEALGLAGANDLLNKVMVQAAGSPIVPLRGYPLSNPTRWLITFCEASGMKWGNTFFLKKRFRGNRWRNAILGQYAWSMQERFRLSRIYGIPNIVDKVNSISWSGPGVAVDNHSYFQFWNGAEANNAITWPEIQANASAASSLSAEQQSLESMHRVEGYISSGEI